MSTKQAIIITDSAKLDALIIETNKKAHAVYASIQLAMASAVYQAVMHGNTNHLNALVAAVGKGVRKTAMAQWILKHGPVLVLIHLGETARLIG